MTVSSSIHLPVTFASIWPGDLAACVLDADSDCQTVKIALMAPGSWYGAILTARRADVARLLWPETTR